MKRSRFSEEQIIGILKKQEAGMRTVEVCRRRGDSPATPRPEPAPIQPLFSRPGLVHDAC
jgi:hypothetical protein